MGQAKEAVDRVWAIMEGDDIDRLTEVVADDLEFAMPGGFDFHTSAEMIEMLRAYKEAFPDLHHQVKDFVESGDTIALELLVQGTHLGTMRGPLGDIPATGKEIFWHSVDYVKVRDGKVASWHVYEDNAAFLAQIGLMQVPTTA